MQARIIWLRVGDDRAEHFCGSIHRPGSLTRRTMATPHLGVLAHQVSSRRLSRRGCDQKFVDRSDSFRGISDFGADETAVVEGLRREVL